MYILSEKEMDFLNRILTKGEIEPALLTADTNLQRRIKDHPMLHWKAMNARQHFGIDG